MATPLETTERHRADWLTRGIRIRFSIHPNSFPFLFFIRRTTHTHSSPICVSSWRDLFWTQPTRLNTIDERTFCHSIILNLIGLHEMYRIYKEPAASAARQTGRRESLWYRGIDDVEGAKEIKRKEGTSEKLEREEERKKNSHNASFHRQVHSNLYPVAKGNCRCYILPSSYLCKSQVPASGPASSST